MPITHTPVTILGIDPGLATVGFGLISATPRARVLLEYGIISTPKNVAIEERLFSIYEQATALIQRSNPDYIGIEDLYFYNNQKTAISVGQARGVLLLACARQRAPIFRLTPLQVKLNLTGYGRASKQQIKKMVAIELETTKNIKPDDAADALAIAITTYFVHIRKN